jgi:glycine betaine/proline transport system ATP-binding protein
MFLGDRIAVMRDGRIVQIGTPEEILTDPANDYVAQFVQDVDRARVLTAASVMEPVRAVVTTSGGPRAALRVMREFQTSVAFVLNRDNSFVGVVRDSDVLKLVKAGETDLRKTIIGDAFSVGPDTPLVDLVEPSVESAQAIAVVDEKKRLIGVIPRVTLLAALGNVSTQTGSLPTIEPRSTIPLSVLDETLKETATEGSAL